MPPTRLVAYVSFSNSNPKMALSSRQIAVALLLAATAGSSYAHEHDEGAIPEGGFVSPDPLVSLDLEEHPVGWVLDTYRDQ